MALTCERFAGGAREVVELVGRKVPLLIDALSKRQRVLVTIVDETGHSKNYMQVVVGEKPTGLNEFYPWVRRLGDKCRGLPGAWKAAAIVLPKDFDERRNVYMQTAVGDVHDYFLEFARRELAATEAANAEVD